MKLLLFYSILLISAFASAQNKLTGQFVLQGTMLNEKTGQLFLSYQNHEGKYITDSAVVSNGSFSFKGKIDGPVMAVLATSTGGLSVDDPNLTELYLEPAAMKIVVSKNAFRDAKVTGSKTQSQNEELQRQINKIRNRWKTVMDTLYAVNKRSNVEFQELKNWVLKPYEQELSEISMSFLNKYPGSYATLTPLVSMSHEMSADTLRKYFSRFSERSRRSPMGRTIQEELERKTLGVPGVTAPNFSTTDIDGKNLSLSDYKGKYVLLDFWASWCVPCRKGNPHLLNVYAKYKDKGFEIIGIASDDGKEEAWKKAVAQDKIGVWKHILSGFDMEKLMRNEKNDKHIGKKYGVATLPTKILIDPNGMIIGRYGESEEDNKAMDKELEKVFNL